MKPLTLKPAASCRFDALALGEVMLRLDPGAGRVRTARSFRVWEGGGEYNVIRALRRCFGQRTALVTAICDNAVGRLLEDLLLQGGVDLSHVQWTPFDGVGRTGRVGLNFTEAGFGVRPGTGTYDRGHTAAAQMRPGAVDWERIFGREGVRWFHTGGIFAALSETTPKIAAEAMRAARRHGTIVSYDLNTRASLWSSSGQATEVNATLVALADVLVGNADDLKAVLGLKDARAAVRQFPNLLAVATTQRRSPSASRNDWGAELLYQRKVFAAKPRPGLEILDRVGGGDGFAAGVIFGLLAGRTPADAVNLGAAHGALVMTTPGDNSMVTLAEVEALARGGDARMKR